MINILYTVNFIASLRVLTHEWETNHEDKSNQISLNHVFGERGKLEITVDIKSAIKPVPNN